MPLEINGRKYDNKWGIYLIFMKLKGLILCSKKKILGVESRDFSQAEKEKTAYTAEQIHKI